MSHLTNDAPSSATIFSPSVARVAASTARDWSYVDSWLASKFAPGVSVPNFERNPETLRALLALAAFNEAADDERQLLARAEAEALEAIRKARDGATVTSPSLRDALLGAVEQGLSREGQTSLDAMANVAVDMGEAFPKPEHLGHRLVDLHAKVYELDQMKDRVDVLRRHIDQQATEMKSFLRDHVQSDDGAYKLPPSDDLARQNLDLQRKIKAMAAQLPELQDRVANIVASVDTSHPTVDDVLRGEQEYLAILSRKKELDGQMAAFAGLPSDEDMARSDVDALRRRLRDATTRRDAVFEGLVERESPMRRR